MSQKEILTEGIKEKLETEANECKLKGNRPSRHKGNGWGQMGLDCPVCENGTKVAVQRYADPIRNCGYDVYTCSCGYRHVEAWGDGRPLPIDPNKPLTDEVRKALEAEARECKGKIPRPSRHKGNGWGQMGLDCPISEDGTKVKVQRFASVRNNHGIDVYTCPHCDYRYVEEWGDGAPLI